jgi:hypothetical protein
LSLVEQWRRIEEQLPEDWKEARLSLAIDDAVALARAAALLGPLNPGRTPGGLRFSCLRGGGVSGRESVRRLLRRLDREGISGRLELVRSERAAPESETPVKGLVAAWDEALAVLPSDWTDLVADIDLRSTDHLDRAALLLAPLNPSRVPGKVAFRFRSARRFGYGASAEMTRRCLERCDEDGISAGVSILWALSDTKPVATQGPVWYVGGRPV